MSDFWVILLMGVCVEGWLCAYRCQGTIFTNSTVISAVSVLEDTSKDSLGVLGPGDINTLENPLRSIFIQVQSKANFLKIPSRSQSGKP